MKCPYKVKVCTECKRILIACEINFAKDKKCKYGLSSKCKKCNKKHFKQYYEEHKEEFKEKGKQYREEHKEELREKKKQYREENKEKIAKHDKQYREENKEKIKERKQRYYKENKEEIKEKSKQYYEENKEEIKEKSKQYNKENPHIKFNNHIKRRQLEENQGNGITKEQWLEMMNYFNWCCAYSGEYIGGDSEFRTIDHIIPLSKGGKHEIWNCVPMYKNYNSSKNTQDMEQWYRQQEYFSEERLAKIYAWIEYAFKKEEE